MSSLIVTDSSYYLTKLAAKEDPFEHLDEFSPDYDFAITGIIWVEVLRGRGDPRLRARFEERFSTMVFLNFNAAATRRAAALAWMLDRRDVVLPATDLAIAACAIEHDAAVLTFDRHFRKIPGVIAVDHLA